MTWLQLLCCQWLHVQSPAALRPGNILELLQTLAQADLQGMPATGVSTLAQGRPFNPSRPLQRGNTPAAQALRLCLCRTLPVIVALSLHTI